MIKTTQIFNGKAIREEIIDGKFLIKNDFENNTTSKTEWGPPKWKELHDRAFHANDLSGEIAWLDLFKKSLPGCECHRHWGEITKLNPVDLTSPDKYFEWTVNAHNEVNKILEKPLFSLENARRNQC